MAHALSFQPLSVPSTLAGRRALNVSQSTQQSANARTFESHQSPRKPWKCEKFLVGSSFEGLRGLCDYERISKKSSGRAHQQKRKDRGICAAVSTGSTNTFTGAGVSDAAALLKEAAKTRKVERGKVTQAIVELEKAKLDPSKFLEHIGGTASPGNHWMLVFSAGAKDVQAVKKGETPKGSYLPVTAVQHFDAQTKLIENGVYLGGVGNLVFGGVFAWKSRQLSFTFDRISIKLGALPPFKFNWKGKGSGDARTPGVGKEGGKDPFFLFAYADEEILVARGRGGGVAFWVRCKNVGGQQW